jgi:hypothetical protein
VHRHGVAAALMQAYYAEVYPSFEVSIFCFCIVCMYGIVVYLRSGLNIIPYCCDGSCGPRLAGAFMCP